MPDIEPISNEDLIVEKLRLELDKAGPSRKKRIIEKFVLAALGSIPWVGGFLSAAADYRAEESENKKNNLQTEWLREHHQKLGLLKQTLEEIQDRFESLDDSIQDRIQSDEYLGIVRKAFRAWDEADTAEKRSYAANLVTNSAGTRVCSDDVVRLFLDWLELYHEAHFAVIKEIFENPGSTRFDIWSDLYGELPTEDSAEADLFKLLIRDLSTGGVIRQERDTNALGQFVRKKARHVKRGTAPSTIESAFEETKPYVLTELGKQFVHYTMNDVVTRISNSN